MKLTFEQIEQIWGDTDNNDVIEISESEVRGIPCVKVVINDDEENASYLNSFGDELS